MKFGATYSISNGLLEDVIIEGKNDDGFRYYEVDGERRDDLVNGIDFSDPHRAAQAWVAVLAAMLMDYRYLYL